MRLLVDSHSFLWFISGSPRLSLQARKLIEDMDNEVFLSVVSLWEIGIKHSLSKLQLHAPFEVLFPEQLDLNRIGLLGIEVEHVVQVIRLPFHHRDPFDRLIIAQAIIEDMPVVSGDDAFDRYDVTRLW